MKIKKVRDPQPSNANWLQQTLSVMIQPVTNCMERKKHGNQMIVLSVFVVTARQNALQQYAAIQTVKTLFISGDSVVLYAP